MSRGDTFRGRQGGRWLPDGVTGRTGELLAGIADAREAALAADRADPLPDRTVELDGRTVHVPQRRWPTLDAHGPQPPATPAGWEALARMADARAHAGVELSELDQRSLENYPTPRTALGQENR